MLVYIKVIHIYICNNIVLPWPTICLVALRAAPLSLSLSLARAPSLSLAFPLPSRSRDSSFGVYQARGMTYRGLPRQQLSLSLARFRARALSPSLPLSLPPSLSHSLYACGMTSRGMRRQQQHRWASWLRLATARHWMRSSRSCRRERERVTYIHTCIHPIYIYMVCIRITHIYILLCIYISYYVCVYIYISYYVYIYIYITCVYIYCRTRTGACGRRRWYPSATSQARPPPSSLTTRVA